MSEAQSHLSKRQHAELAIALPGITRPLANEDVQHVHSLLCQLDQFIPLIERRDACGLLVLRMVSEFLVEPDPNAAALALRDGLAFCLRAVPERMWESDFALPPLPLPDPLTVEGLLGDAQTVLQQWLGWFHPIFNPYRTTPRSDREALVRRIALAHCFRPVHGGQDAELVACHQALRKVQRYHGRRGRVVELEDPLDLLRALHASAPAERIRCKIMYVRRDGQMAFSVRGIRDLFRAKSTLDHRSALEQHIDDVGGARDRSGEGPEDVPAAIEATEASRAAELAIQGHQERPASSRARAAVRKELRGLLMGTLTTRDLSAATGLDRRGLDRALERERAALRAMPELRRLRDAL